MSSTWPRSGKSYTIVSYLRSVKIPNCMKQTPKAKHLSYDCGLQLKCLRVMVWACKINVFMILMDGVPRHTRVSLLRNARGIFS